MERSIRWMLLGAGTGIGHAVARSCRASGGPPLVGAIDVRESKIAERFRYACRAVDLEDEERIARQLLGVDLVVQTGRMELATLGRLARACARSGCALLDLSDQIPEHLALLRHGEMLESMGIPWVVSAGAASVAASLLSAHLHDLLPDASSLELVTEGPDPRLAGIDLRWWRTGAGNAGWRVRSGMLERRSVASLDSREPLQAYPWRADLAEAQHGRREADVDALVRMPVPLRSPRLRKALADRPLAASRIEHCVHRFGPPGLRRLTASGTIRHASEGEKRATIAVRDALEMQVRVVHGVLAAFRRGSLPPGAHTPLAALGPTLADVIGLGRTIGR